jgi:uncharacterized protein
MAKDYRLESFPITTQRRPHLVMDDAAVRALLSTGQVGNVATVWDRQPFINATTYWYDAEVNEILFHSNIVGRVRANAEHCDRVCFETSRYGRLLPSNIALEFSIQYESVVAFGAVRLLREDQAKHRALTGLIAKYFPGMQAGRDYRPLTDQELTRTTVYAIAIEQWSGKRNWPERAQQGDEWPPLGKEWTE